MDSAQKADPRDRTEAEPRHTNPTPTMEEVIDQAFERSMLALDPDELVQFVAQALRQAGFIHRSEVLSDGANAEAKHLASLVTAKDTPRYRQVLRDNEKFIERHLTNLLGLAALGEEKEDG